MSPKALFVRSYRGNGMRSRMENTVRSAAEGRDERSQAPENIALDSIRTGAELRRYIPVGPSCGESITSISGARSLATCGTRKRQRDTAVVLAVTAGVFLVCCAAACKTELWQARCWMPRTTP